MECPLPDPALVDESPHANSWRTLFSLATLLYKAATGHSDDAAAKASKASAARSPEWSARNKAAVQN